MGNFLGRQRRFPPGTPTERRFLTFSSDEIAQIEHDARESKTSFGEFVAKAATNPVRSITSSDAIMLAIELRAVKEEMARFRLPRRENPGDRDEFDSFIASRIRYIDSLVEGLAKL